MVPFVLVSRYCLPTRDRATAWLGLLIVAHYLNYRCRCQELLLGIEVLRLLMPSTSLAGRRHTATKSTIEPNISTFYYNPTVNSTSTIKIPK